MRMNKRLTNYNHVKQTNRAWAWQAVIAFLYGSTPLRLYQINPRLLRSRLFGTWPQRRLNKPCPKLENKRQAWQCRRDCHPAARGGVVLQPFEYNKCVRFCPLNLFIKDSFPIIRDLPCCSVLSFVVLVPWWSIWSKIWIFIVVPGVRHSKQLNHCKDPSRPVFSIQLNRCMSVSSRI